MATTFKWVLKDPNTNQYRTSRGWSDNIAEAISFSYPNGLDGLDFGDFILVPVWSITG
jgi:hypothetical protein